MEQNVFMDLWKKAQRIIKQRNSALRLKNRRKDHVEVWNAELINIAELTNKIRKEYISKFTPIFLEIVENILNLKEIEVRFYSGWDDEKSFSTVLDESLERDLKLGYTSYGPHRADLKIFVNKFLAHEVLSRGQQKLLAYSMYLTQAKLLENVAKKKSVFLIDDLSSELDGEKRKVFCKELGKLRSQVFITSIDPDIFDDEALLENGKKMFHVKQGRVSESEERGKQTSNF